MHLLPNLLPASLLALTVGLSAMDGRAETWEAYRPVGPHQTVGAGFRVYMPAEFDQLEKKPGGVAGVQAESGGMKFAAFHRPHPVRPDSVDADLDAIRDAAVKHAGNVRLRGEKRLKVSGMPARELMLENTSGAVVGLRRFVLVNGWLIELAVNGPPGLEAKVEPQWFVGSLALVGPQHSQDEPPVREYVVCFNGRPCGGMPCPSTSAFDLAAGQELQGIYFDLEAAPADVRAQISDDDMFKGRLVLAGRMTQGQVAESREYPLLRVTSIVRQAEAAERRHCAVRD